MDHWRMSAIEYRAQFDAVVSFSKAAGLRADGFRVDVPGPDVTEQDVASLFRSVLARPGDEKRMPSPSSTGSTYTRISSTSPDVSGAHIAHPVPPKNLRMSRDPFRRHLGPDPLLTSQVPIGPAAA
jgi:hypothetical protein